MAAQVSQDKLKEAMEKGEQKFKDAIEKAKDNPEAREAMEKALKEFHKAMEEKIQSAPKGGPGDEVRSTCARIPRLPADAGVQFEAMQGGQFQFAPGGDGKAFMVQGGQAG